MVSTRMSESSMEDALSTLAIEAGRAILSEYANQDSEATVKADGSPLTLADLASHAVIMTGLKKLTPGMPVLSEESAAIPAEERQAWNEFWLVDPLDGTKEFIKRNGEFTVNIALVRDGRPVAGVVHAPALGVTWFGQVGRGASRRVGDGLMRPIVPTIVAESPLRVVASRSHNSPATDAFLARVGPHTLVPAGSSLKICKVADGSADVYPRLAPTMEWDTAAGQAVLEAAGGVVRAADGAPLRYNKENLLNPHFIAAGSADWLAHYFDSAL